MNVKPIILSLKLFVGYVLALAIIAAIHPSLMNTEMIIHPETFGSLYADFVLPLSLLVLGSGLLEIIISIFNYVYTKTFQSSQSKETPE